MKTEKPDFQYGQLPASPKFLRLYKHLSNAETCYLNWIITHRDRSKPGLRTLPIADTTVAEKLEYSFLTIRDARLRLAKQGIITTTHFRKQTHICEILPHWYRNDKRPADNEQRSEDDYTDEVKSATKPKSSSLRNTNAESGTNTHQERFLSAAPTLPTAFFTAVLTASSSQPSSNMKSNPQNPSRNRRREEYNKKAKGSTANPKSSFHPTLEMWYKYSGVKQKYDESKIHEVLNMIMDRYDLDDVGRADDLLQLAITDHLPRRGTNRLRYLTGITTTPQGIHALDQAHSKLRPQAATESDKSTIKGPPAKRAVPANKIEEQEVAQQSPPMPMRRSGQVESDTTTNHSTVGPEKYRELLSKLSKDFKMNNHD